MTAARALPAPEPPPSANERLKSRFRSLFWTSMIAATVAHFGVFAYWPELSTSDFSFTVEELVSIDLPPEIEIPPPPQHIARPATPVMAAAEVPEDVTIAPTTFELNPVTELPPPPPQITSAMGEGEEEGPRFTPFTVAPTILNRGEVARAMVETYPPLLRSAGIGGTVMVYFFIDEEGRVRDFRIQSSSGHPQLDEAALAVAGLYRFSPALNRDKRVPVWVVFLIEFQVR